MVCLVVIPRVSGDLIVQGAGKASCNVVRVFLQLVSLSDMLTHVHEHSGKFRWGISSYDFSL